MVLARTFDSTKRTQGFFAHIAALTRYPADIWRNRYMVQNFSRRELMGRFHGSVLGAWWMLVQPVFMFIVYFLVFGVMYNRFGDDPSVGYALYLFSGVIGFHALVEATSTCCSIVVANGNLVKKVAFPSEVLPIPVALVSVVLYLVGAVVCVLIGIGNGLIVEGGAGIPDLHLLALPLVLIVNFVMVLGIGLLLGNANVFIRDVGQVWRIFTMAWMFLSPVFWSPDLLVKMMPNSVVPSIMMNANPAYPLLMAQRICLAGEIPEFGITGFWGYLGTAALWAFGFLVIGFTTFVANKHKHSDIV